MSDWRKDPRYLSLSSFQRAVYELCSAIPKGRCATYGLLAEALDCGSSQAIGSALHHNPFAPVVPCHRVLKKSSSVGATLGGFSGVAESAGASNSFLGKKAALLASEGVLFDKSGLNLLDPERVLLRSTSEFGSEPLKAALKHLGVVAVSRPTLSAEDKMVKKESKPAASSSAMPSVGSKRARDEEDASALPHSEGGGGMTALRASLSVPGVSTGHSVRLACRDGRLKREHTSGLAPGYAQANLVILPKEYARDFLAFCTRNPKPCPLLEVTEAGDYNCPLTCPSGCDIRTDLPRYRVWRDGKLSEEVDDIKAFWPDKKKGGKGSLSSVSSSSAASSASSPEVRDDWVAFLLGCSFSFEEALLNAGLPVRHLQEEKEEDETGADAKKAIAGGPAKKKKKTSADADGPALPLAVNPRNVPMYRTCVPCVPAGPFSGPLVVSMRPMTPEQAKQAASVTEKFQRVHGRPVYAGDPKALGIEDVDTPHYGDRVTINKGEVPVFWACGVTPQAALLQAKVPIAITHAPGHMVVLDALNSDLSGPAELDVAPFLKDKKAVNHVALSSTSRLEPAGVSSSSSSLSTASSAQGASGSGKRGGR